MTTAIRDAISPDLRATLRALKLGQMLDTLPDRLTLARQQNMTHADFLELVLADEVTRREAKSAALRARAAGLDPGMRLDTWDATAAVRYDQQLWNELASLRFLDARPRRPAARPGRGRQDPPGLRARAHRHPPPPRRAHGPRRQAVQTAQGRPAGQHPGLRDAPPGHRRAAHHRRPRPPAARRDRAPATSTSCASNATSKAATIVTSNRHPDEWLTMMADPLLAQSAIDRLVSTAHELIIEGPSYRQRQKPTVNGAFNGLASS